MLKYRYVKAQLAKTNKKNDENYVVTRIWNKLDNEDIKFVTQQYVRRPDGKYALTDMFFPQLNVHVEIDEGYHLSDLQMQEDRIRQNDIVSVTNHGIYRIDVTTNLKSVHKQIDALVEELNKKIKEKGTAFIPWEVEKEFSPETYIERGYIDLKDNIAFRTCKDVANVFGHRYKGFQQGGTMHPYFPDTLICFPKLYPNGEWDNTLSFDGKTIEEKNKDNKKARIHMEKVIESEPHKRIVFAKVKGPLGYIMYKFKGEFKLDKIASTEKGCLVWNQIAESVKTYPPLIKK